MLETPVLNAARRTRWQLAARLQVGSTGLAAGVASPDAARLAAVSVGPNPWAVNATDLAAVNPS
jgi:hypothetical protein